MKKEEIQALFKYYENAACTIDNTECWSARDLQKLFGYKLWQNFTNVIVKAGATAASHDIEMIKENRPQ
jgi:DNA-damage-inducible protein D